MKKGLMIAVIIAIVILMTVSLSLIGCKTTAAGTTAVAETTAAVTTAAAAETTAAAEGPKPLKLGYCTTSYYNPPNKLIVDSGVAACKDPKWSKWFSSVDVIVLDAGKPISPAVFQSNMEDLYNQGVQGVLLHPGGVSVEASKPVKELFNKNNIPVAITDNGIESGDYVIYTVTDNYAGGVALAELQAKLLKKGDKVQAFNGVPNAINVQARVKGYEDKMKELGMNVLPTWTYSNFTSEQSMKNMEDLMVSNPDIKGVFCMAQVECVGVIRAVDNAKMSGKISIVSYDVEAEAYKAIQEGRLLACAVQDLVNIGKVGGEGLMTYLTGGKIEKKDVVIPPLILTKDNYKDFADNPQVFLGK